MTADKSPATASPDIETAARRRAGAFDAVIADIRRRSTSAIVSRSEYRSPGLNRHLVDILERPAGSAMSLISEPVFELAKIWKPADLAMRELAGSLLTPELVTVLDAATTGRLPLDMHPYRHQHAAWRAALASGDMRPFIVSSGTGSGKTECFMVPMIDDLLKVSATAGGGLLEGVHAIMLYPLNALIESQKERLSAWTRPLADRLRFALYNGDTPHAARKDSRIRARETGEIDNREDIRATPPPVLVTNLTMLEYMLLRGQDRSIIEKSRGRLRWIILDEAHTYVGSRAAELALLLRRVRSAFDVDPDSVRLVATSATIGDDRDPARTKAAMRRFIGSLAGVDPARVEVIFGEEQLPNLPAETLDRSLDLASINGLDPAARWQHCASHPRIRALRTAMGRTGQTLGAAATLLSGGPDGMVRPEDASRALAILAETCDPEGGQALLPWRMHLFHRPQAGLWACVAPNCPERSALLADPEGGWGFGQVYVTQRERCVCGAPVYEICGCDNCGTEYLLAQQVEDLVDPRRLLRQPARARSHDDFEADYEGDEAEEDEEDGEDREESFALGTRVYVAPVPEEAARSFLGLKDGVLYDARPAHVDIIPVEILAAPDVNERTCCHHGPLQRIAEHRYGPNFFLGNDTPPLLGAMPPKDPKDQAALRKPSDGRRLISFSDSRQGTARLAAKLQQEAEVSLTRATIYHMVQQEPVIGTARQQEINEAHEQVEAMEAALAAMPTGSVKDKLAATLEKARARLAGLMPERGASWADAVERLSKNPELGFAAAAWGRRIIKDEVTSEQYPALAAVLLFREFQRRPRKQLNAETMGLARMTFPSIDAVAAATMPAAIGSGTAAVTAWTGLTHAAIDLVLRATLSVALPNNPFNVAYLISPRQKPGVILAPGQQPTNPARERAWPSIAGIRRGKPALLLRIAARVAGIDLDDESRHGELHEILERIWLTLSRANVLKPEGDGWQLKLETAHFRPMDDGWICPVTRRIFGYNPGGISPHAPEAGVVLQPLCMPRLPVANGSGLGPAERQLVLDWLRRDPAVAALRDRALWSGIHDRVAAFTPYFRAQEHSAQIDRPSLRDYVAKFDAGDINVLNCSTTMEMGVDLENVGAVVNANLPPAIANYRQRAGRAGRRGEPWALTLTFCKDLPLDWSAFRAPAAYLATTAAVPTVHLDSATITQRHVNALLLARFFRMSGGISLGSRIGAFFGGSEEPLDPLDPDCAAVAFADHLEAMQGGVAAEFAADLRELVLGTGLADVPSARLVARAATAFEAMSRKWRAEHEALMTGLAAAGTSAAQRFYKVQIRRLREEFLISELARRSFTPSYGMPVDVVTFENRVGKLANSGGPSRTLDIAIRDYAPGSELVVDGLVYRSDGFLPAWANPLDLQGVEDLRTLWSCDDCGAQDIAAEQPSVCPVCASGSIAYAEGLCPAGFLGEKEPHTAYEKISYVKPDPARVRVVDGASWQELPGAAGRYRASAVGSVTFTSSGETGFGFAVCLCCGRGATETAIADSVQPAAIAGHYPLFRREDNQLASGRCIGSEPGSWKLRRNVKLFHQIATDVFELQVPAIAPDRRGLRAALALGAALREVLTKTLGIEAAEVGVVADRLYGTTTATPSILLYDKASGGSGITSLLARNGLLSAALPEVRRRLDCPHCASGCPECILRSDLQYEIGSLDRRGALAIVELMIEAMAHSVAEGASDGPTKPAAASAVGSGFDAPPAETGALRG